jgi:hypothetical protein
VLSQDDLLPWCLKLGLPESTQTLIASIRASEPVRRVGGGTANVVGRYPSKKMGRVQSFRLEFHDPTLQLDQLRLAVGSPVCRTVKHEHCPFGPHDRLEGPGLPVLILQRKVRHTLADLRPEL